MRGKSMKKSAGKEVNNATNHYIQLTEDTMCAHDKHEMTKYPRPWFKAKPMLHTGTLLEVKEVWTNFYGSYYRCETIDGTYDIPIEKAKDITVDFQMKLAETLPGVQLKAAVNDLKRELDNAYGAPMRKTIVKAVDKGWNGLLKILMPICVLIRQFRKGDKQ